MHSKLSIAYLCIRFKEYMSYKAIILGASGLIGSKLIKEIIDTEDFSEVVLLNRRSVNIDNKKVRQVIVDFDDLGKSAAKISGDIIFSCLGTTKSKTPNPADYRKIDFEFPLTTAKIGIANGVQQFHVVTSLGADPNSSSPYLKLKGEIENELKNLPFKSLHIYQPSFLTGHRQEQRFAEKILGPLMSLIEPFFFGKLSQYKSIEAKTVAKAMVNQSLKNQTGIYTYPSNIIKQLA